VPIRRELRRAGCLVLSSGADNGTFPILKDEIGIRLAINLATWFEPLTTVLSRSLFTSL